MSDTSAAQAEKGVIDIRPDGRVEAAYLISRGSTQRGVVLVHQKDHKQWVTWHCHLDPQQSVWECTTGHYFLENVLDPELAEKQAKYDFGLRIGQILESDIYKGVN